MRKFFFFMMLFCTGVVIAQNEAQTATLQTGDKVQVFYGNTALKEAYSAAEDGSVITLSEGKFSGLTNIQKSISICGNGFEDNEAEGIHKTELSILASGKKMEYSTNDGTRLQNIKLEGIYLTTDMSINNTTNMIISKCSMNSIDINDDNDNYAEAISFRQCYIRDGIHGRSNVRNVEFQNCYIGGIIGMGSNNAAVPMNFNHCILANDQNYKGVYTNCIVTKMNSEASTVQSCICQYSKYTTDFNYGNWYDVDFNTLFADDTSIDYAPEKTFQLKFPDAYIGTDGTQVGINGGKYPWNKIPSTPFVKDLQVQVNGTTLNVTYEAQVR